MADSWEDWDDDEATPVIPTAAGQKENVNAKFVGEDEEEEAPKWQGTVPKTQAAKPKKASKYDESRGMVEDDEGPLDDPLAERLRLQKLMEDSDLKNAEELFGSKETVRELEGFDPKSAKDFEEYAISIVAKYLKPHFGSAQYKACVKHLCRRALAPLTAAEAKDVETSIAGIRSDKLKEEKAANAGKKAQKKASLNVGRSGGTAGLDDYVFDDAGPDDDYDFM